MRPNWFGLAHKLWGIVPNLPSDPGLVRGAQPERTADRRKLVKDDTDEALNEDFACKVYQERCRDRVRLQRAGSAVLWNPTAPSAGAGTTAAANLQRSDHSGQLISGPGTSVF
jgi:hypothetical protein